MPFRTRAPTAAAAALVLGAAVAGSLGTAFGSGGGDGARGRQLFDKHCAVCHSVTSGLQMDGPSLHRIVGRKAGTVPLFGGYRALKGSDVVWDESALDAWLADPRGFADGRDTRMNVRIDGAADRADIIAYLKTLR